MKWEDGTNGDSPFIDFWEFGNEEVEVRRLESRPSNDCGGAATPYDVGQGTLQSELGQHSLQSDVEMGTRTPEAQRGTFPPMPNRFTPIGWKSRVSSLLRGRPFLWTALCLCGALGLTIGYLIGSRGFTSPINSPMFSAQSDSSLSNTQSSAAASPRDEVPTKGNTLSNVLVVDVQGDVVHPGIVHLGADARILDAVLAAGGFQHQEDASQVNLAAPVNDGDEVVIPYSNQRVEGDANASRDKTGDSSAVQGSGMASTGKSSSITGRVAGPDNSPIDLNTADEATLETIPGIGPSKASAIVAYRQAHGPFTDINDLLKIRGIGTVTLSHISHYVTIVGGR